MQVGAGGRRGPSVGVRVSSKRQKEPIVLTPSQVAAGVALLEMRDQLLVFMDGSLGIRRGELGALRWTDCDFETDSFNICHSYYWLQGGTSEGHEINRFRKAIADASRPQTGSAGVESTEPLQPSGGFHFPVSCAQREKAIGSRGGTSKKNPACFSAAGNFRCWLAYLQTLGWNHARRDGRAPTHDPRLPAARESERHKQVSSGDGDEQAGRSEQAGRGHSAERNSGSGVGSTFGPIINWTLIEPRFLEVKFVSY
jgi:hypothetical protein